MLRKKILVVDDEPKIVELVKLYLEKDGYGVLTAGDGQRALELAQRELPDLIILDLNLPEKDGLEVCKELRRQSQVPIVMLTARDEDVDKILGLELGADDYVTKPFSPRELIARVRSVLRRASPEREQGAAIRVGDLTLDPRRHVVHRGEGPVQLTPIEFKLLEVLMANPGRVFTRLQLLDQVQGEAYEGYERTIDTHVKNLRQKIEPEPQKPQYILTVHGVGYKFQEKVGA